MNLSLNYDNAKYTEFNGPCFAGQHPDEGCAAGQPLPPFQDLSGQKLAVAPKVTGVLGGRYEIPVGASGSHFDISGNARYSDEYLASGKPVVASATQAMGMFSEHVSLCVTKEEFVCQIRKILTDPVCTSEHLSNIMREFALKHTWENSVGEMGDAFNALKKYHQIVEI